MQSPHVEARIAGLTPNAAVTVAHDAKVTPAIRCMAPTDHTEDRATGVHILSADGATVGANVITLNFSLGGIFASHVRLLTEVAFIEC
jgi:hypothetical protein